MWNTVQSAVQGISHVSDNTPCQDKTYAYSDDEITVIALADGAGSARLSHFGAECITEYICGHLKDKFEEYYSCEDGAEVKKSIIEGITERLKKLAEDKECEIKALASTLLAVAVKDERYILLHIGDGVIGYSRPGRIKVASHPMNGEYANLTYFTTSSDAITMMKLIKGNLGNIDGFVLMSDGTENSLYDKRNHVLGNAVKRIMYRMRIFPEKRYEQYVQNSMTLIRDNTHDDCSLIIMTRTNGEPMYECMTLEQKCILLGLNGSSRRIKRIIRKYDKLHEMLKEKPCSLHTLERGLHIKCKAVQTICKRLVAADMIARNGALYTLM